MIYRLDACRHACNPSSLSLFLLWTRRNRDFAAKHWEETPNIQWKSSVYPWDGEGLLVVQCLSQQWLPVRLVYVHHCLAQMTRNRWSTLKTSNSCPHVQLCSLSKGLTMFQNLSKATTNPEHTPLSPLKVLMWTLTLIFSWTHRCSSPKGLPWHTENTGQVTRCAGLETIS